jgi:hypothetical protein
MRSGFPSLAGSVNPSGVVGRFRRMRTDVPVSETAGKMSATRLSPTNSVVTAADLRALGR